MYRALILSLLAIVSASAAEVGTGPAWWSVLPFVLLLTAIAVMPLVAAKFWHHWYPHLAIGLGLLVAGYYLVGLGQTTGLIHVAFEYAGFISLIACLFLCSGGVVVRLGFRGEATTNLGLLLFGAVVANLIGTTGASMLLIRPFLKINQGRLRPYHLVFFIFMVSNVGGALTPIGDPPLLMGFLRGIEFFRFFELNFLPWATTLALLGAVFWLLDKRNLGVAVPEGDQDRIHGGTFTLFGARNLLLLFVALGCVFLDPNRIAWMPGIGHDANGWRLCIGKLAHGETFSFVREILLLAIGWFTYAITPKRNLAENGFTFAPIKEVALLFIGIFLTMLPALDLIRVDAQDGTLLGIPLQPWSFYLGTGLFSGVLDNAPTFIAFLAGLEGKTGLTAAQIGASADPIIASNLAACACASVFFGAMTYIGNGPNFMVKSIVEDSRDRHGRPLVEVPSFFGYIVRYALPILLPVLLIVGLLFFWQ
jgi:Na+/H+ antiporter NhaD/arsenite permease-like protein